MCTYNLLNSYVQSTTPEKASLRAKLAENKRNASFEQSGSLKLRPGSIKLAHPPSPATASPNNLSVLTFNYALDSDDMEKLLSLVLPQIHLRYQIF